MHLAPSKVNFAKMQRLLEECNQVAEGSGVQIGFDQGQFCQLGLEDDFVNKLFRNFVRNLAVNNSQLFQMIGQLLVEQRDNVLHRHFIERVLLVNDGFEVVQLGESLQDGRELLVVNATVIEQHSVDRLVEE